jgi:predicted alpha/beta hydrolase family esterase
MVPAVPDRAFLLLHGLSHRRPPEHWQCRLAYALRERGERVYYPGLPFEDEPRYEEWAEALRWSLRQIADAGERVVVCNSMSGLLWMGFAVDPPPEFAPVDRLLLVSPPDPARLPESAADFREIEIDGPAVRASVRTTIRIANSEADPYNPTGGGMMYGKALGADFDLIEGAAHIGPADGYGPWPSLEAWCLDSAQRIPPNS